MLRINKEKKKTGREYTRSKVRERDNYTCQDCGKVRTPEFVSYWGVRSFDVHHTSGLCGKKSRDYDRISNMDGLITLCHKCHYGRHDFNGKEAWEDTRRRHEEIYKPRAIEAIGLRRQGLTFKKIGEKYGITGESIRQFIHKYEKKGLA